MQFDRITTEPEVMGGKACIRGMRVTVALLVHLVAEGMSFDAITRVYPYIEPDDIRQALRYAAWLAEEVVSVKDGGYGIAPPPYHPVALEGLWEGVHISDDDIANVQREMWSSLDDGDI